MTTTAILIPLLPLFAGVVISVLGKRFVSYVPTIGISATVGAGILSIVTLYSVSSGEPFRVTLWPLQDDGSSFFTFGMLVDRLTAVMMVLITGVSTVIHVFSVRYLRGDSGYARFFALLGFITFVILALVSSPNLLMLFVFWQLLSWALYLILAFNFSHVPAYQNAFKTFIVHRVGDVAFLCGLVLTYHYFGTLEFAELFRRASEQVHVISLLPGNLLDVTAPSVITHCSFSSEPWPNRPSSLSTSGCRIPWTLQPRFRHSCMLVLSTREDSFLIDSHRCMRSHPTSCISCSLSAPPPSFWGPR